MGYNQMMDMLFRGNPELCCKHCGHYLGTWRLFKAGLWSKIRRRPEVYPVRCRTCHKESIVDREKGREYLGILGEQAKEWKDAGKKP